MDTSSTGKDRFGSNVMHNSYFVTLAIHGRRQLLADKGVLASSEMRLTLIGNAVATIWQTLPQHFPRMATEAFYLMPDGICGIVTVDTAPGGDTATLRLLNHAISYFKSETTRVFNSGSTQDYRSRLWQTAFQCEAVATSAELIALQQQLTAQSAYRMW
ncbi:hypothetical protein ACS3UN_09365 [Oscillospiraceae bacterium LTW-04]|nr:hypothetical protein RBH76_11125 [Oscillospiraceae bacterium MB24-C1]